MPRHTTLLKRSLLLGVASMTSALICSVAIIAWREMQSGKTTTRTVKYMYNRPQDPAPPESYLEYDYVDFDEEQTWYDQEVDHLLDRIFPGYEEI